MLERNAHDQWDGARDDAQRRRSYQGYRLNGMVELHGRMSKIADDITAFLNETKGSYDHAREEEHRVIDAKKAATEVMLKTSQLENLLMTRDIEFSVEEAVRHILQIVHTVVSATVDSDVHVQGMKAQIIGEVANKYGDEGARKLTERKAYLPFDV